MYAVKYPMSMLELKTRKMYDIICAKPIANDYNQNDKDEALYPLEVKIDAWDREKNKHRINWELGDQKLRGIFRSTTDQRYHLNLDKCQSSFEIWKRLKKDSNQDEASTLMSLLANFFNAKFIPGEALLDFSARVRSIANQITLQGGKPPTWEEIICFRILSKLPAEYDQIQQSIFQLEWKKINIEMLEKKFNQEDARQLANREIQKNEKPSKQSYSSDSAFATQDKEKNEEKEERKCSDCQKSTRNNNIRCSPCFFKYKKDHPEEFHNEKKKEATTDKKKESSNQIQVFHLAEIDDNHRSNKSTKVIYM
jgi:hypothetical protein